MKNSLLSFMAVTFLAQASFAVATQDCNDQLSIRKSTRDSYAALLRMSRNAVPAAKAVGLENRSTIDELIKVAFVTETDFATVAKQAMAIAAIKSPKGIPDGDELNLTTLRGILFVAYLTHTDPKIVFAKTLEYLPLAENKVNSEGALLALMKLGLVHHIEPKAMVAKIDEFDSAVAETRAEIAKKQTEEFEKKDKLTQSLMNLAGFKPGMIDGDIILALIEASVEMKKPISDSVKALKELIAHPRATQYSIHEQVAMVKALLVFGQSIDKSVEKLAALQKGANEKFGSDLGKEIEQPAVNLILLSNRTPESVLEQIEQISKAGEKYSGDAAALVLTQSLYRSANSTLQPETVRAAVQLTDPK